MFNDYTSINYLSRHGFQIPKTIFLETVLNSCAKLTDTKNAKQKSEAYPDMQQPPLDGSTIRFRALQTIANIAVIILNIFAYDVCVCLYMIVFELFIITYLPVHSDSSIR